MRIKNGPQVASTLTLILTLFTAGCTPHMPNATISFTSSQTATKQAAQINTAPRTETTTPTGEPSTTPTRSGASGPLDSVHMINEAQGWGIANQSVLRTNDGGKSWSNVTPAGIETIVSTIPAEGLGSYELKGAFLDTQIAWIAAPGLDRITLFRTSDGGRTWQATELVVSTPQQVYPIDIISLTYLNAQIGWLLRSTGASTGHEDVELYQTQNSGATWRLIAKAQQTASGELGTITTSGQKTGVGFRDPTNGWLTGYSMGNAIYVYRTKDGGLTWDQQQLPMPDGYTAEGGSARSYPPIFFDDQNGLMPIYLGGSTPGINLFFYITTDGGDRWSPTTPLSSPANDFVWSWSNASHGLVAEEDTGILYSTSNGGEAWSKNTLGGLKFSQLDFVSPGVGWGISQGSLIQTSDGGKNWHTIYP